MPRRSNAIVGEKDPEFAAALAGPSTGIVLIDTNVLLAATEPSRAEHVAATRVLNDWPQCGVRLCTSGQILREYLVVATRPAEVNGLALDRVHACENVAAMLARMRFLEETHTVFARLQTLLAGIDCCGKQVHDANVVATALTHDVESIVTANVDHFLRFDSFVEVLALDEV
ncbi:MAG: type II toxin-antitoxin system VapC family toxin [Acidobacteriota bacterium]|nr:MAG: type II toxin-antitoxin system VapC family toxin [Acidobacteriota bacterium]